MTVVHDITTKKCANCGKEISILHPDHWAYKRVMKNVNIFWCSWSCLRQSEKEGKLDMKKLTLDDKKHAVQIALDGGNPLEYIRMCGIANAAEAWGKIKNNLKEKDPKTWEKLPKRLPNPVMDRKKEKTEEAPADEVTKAAIEHPERPIVQIEGPVIVDKIMEMQEKRPKIDKPLAYGSFTVRAIEGKFGRVSCYKLDHVMYFNFESLDRHDEIDMPVEKWKAFLEEIQEAAAVLGVEL